MRPRRPKQYCLQLVMYIYIYIYTRFQKHCNLKNIYTYIHLLSSQRENKRINMKTKGIYIYMYIYFSRSNVFENGCVYIYIYIYIYITMFIYSISFHMDFNTGLFRGPTKSWSTHQLNSIYTVASLGFIYISSMIVTKFKLKEQ